MTTWSDDFTVGSDVNLSAHTDWDLYIGSAGDLTIAAVDDFVEHTVTANSSQACLFTPAGISTGDVEVECDVYTDNNVSEFNWVGVVARADSGVAFNMYSFEIDCRNDSIEMWRYDSVGGDVQLAQTTFNCVQKTWYTFRLRVEGSGATVSLTGWIDDVQQLTADDTSGDRHTSGDSGLYGYGDAVNDNRWDLFSVSNDFLSTANPYYAYAQQ